MIGSLGDSWTIQVPYLGDHYNVLAAEPDFSEKFEAGEAKYATSEAGLKSFQKSLTFSHTLTRITQQLHTQMHAISL